MRRMLLVVLAVVAASLALVSEPASGVTQQFLWYDQQVTHTYRSYAEPTQSAATPPNWGSPVDYVNGRVYTRFQVLEKPSTKELDAAICVWRNNFVEESCSLKTLRFTTTGTYYVDFGVPGQWWKKNGSWSWATPFSPTRFMIKDPTTGKLMMTMSCGAHCSTEAAIAGHVPLRFDVATVVVAKGATLVPPSDWTGCPAAWSPSCPNPGPNTSTSSTASTSTSSTSSTSTSSTSTSSTSTTTPPPTNGKVALIVGNAASIPPKDVPIRNRLTGLGRSVVLVDDDNLASSAALGGAGLVVVSSSVVPSKIPAWLATHPVPILDAEAYVQTTLRLATSGKELAGLTTLRIVNASHPLAAGRSGDIAVQSAAPLAVGTPVPAATIVARVPGASTASVYGIETGAALRTGTAPARRVGFFFSYDSPPALGANGWALFDAAIRWLTPSTTPPPPPPSGWAHSTHGYRLPVTVGAASTPRSNRPAVVPVDFGAALTQASASGAFGPNTVRVVEVDTAGAVLDADVPFQFDPNAGDPDTGELVVLLTGTTAASASRRYDVYFDVSTAPISAATVTPLVTTTDDISDAGQSSVRVATQAGTWFLHKAGGGFSSLVDSSGMDWLSYSTAAGSAGAYRGIPNAVHPAGHFHPGATTSNTQILRNGPLRATLVSTTTDGKWQFRYDLYPRFSTMTMTRSDAPYWFLYEGTPGGQIDATTDVVIRNSGAQTPLSEAWSGDLAGEEWTAFADTTRNRSLFVAHHNADTGIDSHRLMEGNMTVFGFGRDNLNKSLTGVHTFTVGLLDAETHATITPSVQDAMRALSTAVGTAQVRP